MNYSETVVIGWGSSSDVKRRHGVTQFSLSSSLSN